MYLGNYEEMGQFLYYCLKKRYNKTLKFSFKLYYKFTKNSVFMWYSICINSFVPSAIASPHFLLFIWFVLLFMLSLQHGNNI